MVWTAHISFVLTTYFEAPDFKKYVKQPNIFLNFKKMQLKSVSLISSLVKTIVAKKMVTIWPWHFFRVKFTDNLCVYFLGEVKDLKIPHEINIPLNQTQIVKRQLTFGPRSELWYRHCTDVSSSNVLNHLKQRDYDTPDLYYYEPELSVCLSLA